jgi:uridylate kinase
VSDLIRVRAGVDRDRRLALGNGTVVTDDGGFASTAFASDARAARRAASLGAKKSVKLEDRLELVFDSEAR